MATINFQKIYSDKVTKVRDIKDIRARASQRLKESRKSKREDALNLHRQVEYIPEVKKNKKKTEQEETLLRLKAFKLEKLKRMEEEKKTKKTPFYSLVRTRHTGGTPFRTRHPLKMPVVSLPPATRARTAMQGKFEFKAKLEKPKTVLNQRIAMIASSTNNKSRKLDKNTRIIHRMNQVNIKPSSSKATQDTKRKNNIVTTKDVSNPSERRLPKNNTSGKNSAGKENVQKVSNPSERRLPKNNTSGKNSAGKENVQKVTSSSKRLSRRNITTRKNSPVNNENTEKLNSLDNTIPDINDLLAERLAEQVVIMSPIENTRTSRRLTRRRPNLSAGYDLVNDFKSLNKESDVKINNQEEDENKTSEIESGIISPKELRTKLNEETLRLTSISDLWSEINMDESIPEDIKDEIFAVVGQTRLLISDKFQQFKSLIDNAECKQEESSTIIKNHDLLGFWEMMYIGVEQLNKKYQNLEDMKNNHWRSCENVPAPAVRKSKKKKRGKKKKSCKAASSKFRDFLKKQTESSELQ